MATPSRASRIKTFAPLIFAMGLFVAATYLMQPSQKAAPPLGGAFQLVDFNGVNVDEKSLLGKPSLLFFGFTHCPDICPTKLFELTQMLNKMGDDAQKINTVFVSIDPKRDTPALMKLYLESFHPSIRAFTGTQEQADHMIKLWQVFVRIIPLQQGDYTMDHTAGVYLLDKNGKFQHILDLSKGTDEALQLIRGYL